MLEAPPGDDRDGLEDLWIPADARHLHCHVCEVERGRIRRSAESHRLRNPETSGDSYERR